MIFLLQLGKQRGMKDNHNQVQIIHSRGNHWIITSTIHARDGVVQVYDSIYSTVDYGRRSVINNPFPSSSSVELIKVQKQIGGKDCAISTALAFDLIINIEF